MFENLSSSERVLAIQRLTALWALNECGLGGILHAFQSPFTGLLVGSIAMICIALITSLAVDKWKTVMSSLIIVLIIKALVSPHTTPTAYIAVTFQAVTGVLIYKSIPGLLFSSVLFATIGLIESAVQRLLVLTILYGNNLWEAVDIWGDWVAEKWGVALSLSSSTLVIYVYLLIHFLAGLFAGWLIYKIIRSIEARWGESKFQLNLTETEKKTFFTSRKRVGWKRYVVFGVLLLMIIIAFTLNPGTSDLQKGLITFLRVAIILVVWFVFLVPLAMKLLQRYLNKRHQELGEQVKHTLDMIPHLSWIIEKSWNETAGLSLFSRWKTFAVHSILYILQYKTNYDTDTHRSDTQS